MLIYGHRGAAGEAPENTIAGFHHAAERGAKYVELDIRLSKDDRLMVVHDDKVNRTTYDKGKINSFSAAELLKMDARRDGPPWATKRDTGIPTLDEVMSSVPEIKGYNIEIKPGSKKVMRKIVEQLAEKFSTRQQASHIVVTSSSVICLEALLDLAPHIPRGYVSIRPNPFPILEKYQCQLLSTNWGNCNPIVVRHAKKSGIQVSVWTVNDPALIGNLYKLKVDSVITDYPSMAIPFLGRLTRS